MTGLIFEKYNFKGIKCIYILLVTGCVVFMAHGNTEAYDLANYTMTYNKIQAGADIYLYTDIGYAGLCKLIGMMGFDFYQFRIVLFGVCLLLICTTAIRYTNHLSFFFFFIFAIPCLWMRNR